MLVLFFLTVASVGVHASSASYLLEEVKAELINESEEGKVIIKGTSGVEKLKN